MQLTIGELSARSGVAASALRYYEKLGLIRSTRTSGNQRRYERTELRRVAFIRVSAQVGVPLTDIQSALESLPRGRTPTTTGCCVTATSTRSSSPRRRQRIARSSSAV